jgi:hypothetical protein
VARDNPWTSLSRAGAVSIDRIRQGRGWLSFVVGCKTVGSTGRCRVTVTAGRFDWHPSKQSFDCYYSRPAPARGVPAGRPMGEKLVADDRRVFLLDLPGRLLSVRRGLEASAARANKAGGPSVLPQLQ